ncbi:MAG: phenylacetate-CoA oxygenase subunit PaaC [Bacteroidetes bacterium]|nr:phenylacetate-CoA oxygenase subunit PaaC [Bacteroidota bacterium]MCZ2133008.1 phenylacetate-CoA oxygenase subunit PaaC [Bacteroidota bacterium]
MSTDALKDLLYRIADDALIIAHRNSEWTGLGPIIEEDIAFSSIAQDKMGHALALYTLLHELGEPVPDIAAFMRNESQYRCCHLAEYPIGEYDFSLIRHLLFDLAEQVRYRLLENSTYEPLAKLARKLRGEIRYHVFHAHSFVVKLAANGTEESKARMQSALNECYPLALGIFEPSRYEAELAASGVFAGESELQRQWHEELAAICEKADIDIPTDSTPSYGGRYGSHTEHLQPLLDEMTEVFRLETAADW